MDAARGAACPPLPRAAGTGHVVLATVLLTLACRRPAPTTPIGGRIALARAALLARDSDGTLGLEDALGGSGAIALDSGRVAFLDFDLGRVSVIGRDGRVLATFGRRGGGPGEIVNARILVRTVDGLGVFDDGKLALVSFTPAGRSTGEIPMTAMVGTPSGILTGLVELPDGSWAFAVRERTDSSFRESLYLRTAGRSRLLVSTPAAPVNLVRLPCGITLSPGPPVFWPTLRWSVSGMRIAYAATADDRVTIWDAATSESTVVLGGIAPPRATAAAAESLPIGLRVAMGGAECGLPRDEALRQRGMAKVRPAIERLLLSPTGALWVELTGGAAGMRPIRVRSDTAIDTLTTDIFPSFFIDSARFVAEERDSLGQVSASVWTVSTGRATTVRERARP